MLLYIGCSNDEIAWARRNFEGGFVKFLSNTLGLLGSKAIPQFSGTLAQIVILSTADKQDEWEFKGQEEEDGGSLLKRGVGGSSKRSGG